MNILKTYLGWESVKNVFTLPFLCVRSMNKRERSGKLQSNRKINSNDLRTFFLNDTLKNNSVSSRTFSALKKLSRTFKTVFRFKLREKERSSSAAKIDILRKKKCTRIKDKNRIYWNLQKKLSNNLLKLCTTSCENRIQ